MFEPISSGLINLVVGPGSAQVIVIPITAMMSKPQKKRTRFIRILNSLK